MKYIIYTDGGSRGNPGPAAAAFIIKNSNNTNIHEQGYYLGLATNNMAEYEAVKCALIYFISNFKDLSRANIEVRSDSQLIVNQLMDNWKIKNQNLKKHYLIIKELEKKIGDVKYQYIERLKNKEADLIVNITLDSQLSGL